MLPSGVFNRRPQQDMAIVRTGTQWVLLFAGLVFLVTLGLYAPGQWLNWLILIGIYGVAVLGMHIMTGLCGQFSMGQSAFMALGAYSTAYLVKTYDVSPWLTLPVAGLTAGLGGLVFGIPALRIKGFYLVLTTIAAQFVIIWVIKQQDWLGGTYGIRDLPRLSIGGMQIADATAEFWWLTLALAAVMLFLAKNIQRTTTGRKFVAVRDNDLAAEVMGINLFRTKLLAFFIGCFYAGVAGWMWAHYLRAVQPELFTFALSLQFLGMIIVGGMGSTSGAVMGVVAIMLVDKAVPYVSDWVQGAFPSLKYQVSSGLQLILFAIVVIIFLLLEPKGLYHRLERIKLYYRLNPFAY
ncbi:MAG: branched-chain amino acid ABC transporter permease [Dehalococcoidia bacterium]|nr:branched-chain amino acid ABC transporter permease [Dehalococcoidia bacterium]